MRSAMLGLLFGTLVLALLLPGNARAQDSTRTQRTRLERIEYTLGATIAFSLFDYLTWNEFIYGRPDRNQYKPLYRGIQALIQAGITYFLYKTCGLNSAVSFNLFWWTWGCDLEFYSYQYIFNPAYPWPNRSHTLNLKDDYITWAGFTPVGLLRPYGDRIPRDVLYPQAMIGFGISMAILW